MRWLGLELGLGLGLSGEPRVGACRFGLAVVWRIQVLLLQLLM